MKALLDKISNLENAIGAGITFPPHRMETSKTVQSPQDEGSSSRSAKRKRIVEIEPPSYTLSNPTESTASSYRHPNDARKLLQDELSVSGKLALYQRNVLETAISLADELSQPSTNTVENDAWDKVPTDFTPGELVQILLQGTPSKP